MKAYRAVMEWRFYGDHNGDEEIWRTIASVWYSSRNLVLNSLAVLRDIRTNLILNNSFDITPPEGDDAFFNEDCIVEFKALRIEELEIFDEYQRIVLP